MVRSPLGDVRVVELGSRDSASFCSYSLALLGAEVLKIETPGSGDEARSHGPFADGSCDDEQSGLHLFLNRGKKSITLNIETPTGMEILRSILREQDILICSEPVERINRLGLDYQSLNMEHLIAVYLTPFGLNGRYKDNKLYDINLNAVSGVSFGIGSPDRSPLVIPYRTVSYFSGCGAATAAIASLSGAKRVGRQIDVAEVQVIAAVLTSHNLVTFIYQGVTLARCGRLSRLGLFPGLVLRCKDGYYCVSASRLPEYLRFLDMLGNPEWTKIPRYRNRRAMHEEYVEEAEALIAPWFMEHSKEELFQLTLKNRIGAGPALTIDEVLNSPHLNEREFFVEVDHPRAGVYKYPVGPWKFSACKLETEGRAPLLGEHNEEIYHGRLGYTGDEIANLRRVGDI
ncbi:CaiB/BaiF CoA transferase family protein [Chloroflexota bacterium]